MDATEEIKSRLSIEDVVGRYVDLKRSGGTYKGLCPFHQEKTPSFIVSPSRGTYHCFGCSRHGDIFTFVMELDRLPFPDALKRLAQEAGVSLPEPEERRPSLSGRLYEANELASQFFRSALQSGAGERARAYLERRGFASTAITMFDLGYAPEMREALVQHLRAKGFDDRLLLAAGLALQDDTGGKLRDRFRGRLMFPIRDRAGRISGFGGRTLGDSQPKYLNSPQTEIFDKSTVLYGIHRSQEDIRQQKRAVLVEGYLDAIRAHIHGYSYTVASLGTAVTVQQLATLGRLTDTVIIALDPDAAGLSAAARASVMALAEVMQSRSRTRGSSAFDLRVARLPEGQGDPDELIRDHPQLWEEALADSVPAFEFYFTQTLSGLDRAQDSWRQEAIERLLPAIQQFSNAAGWQATWLQRLATETGVNVRALQHSLPAARPSPRRRRESARSNPSGSVVTETTAQGLARDPQDTVQRALLALLLKAMVVPASSIELLQSLELGRDVYRIILRTVLDWQRHGSYDYEMLRERVPEEARHEADALHAMDIPLPEDGKLNVAIAYHAARLRHFRLQAQQTNASQILRDLAPEDRPVAVQRLAELMQERQEVEQDLDRLSRQVLQTGTV